MSLKLNQLVALEKGSKTRHCSETSAIYKLIQKPALFNGLTKTYASVLEGDSESLPPETQRVQQRVPDVLKKLRALSSIYFDITARKEWTNSAATANVVVDGSVLLENVPVTYLLFLEKQLVDIRTEASKLPVLDETEEWKLDETTNLFKTDAIKTHRTKKMQKPLVLYAATPEHPAQTVVITEDVIAGHWTAVKQSGAISKIKRDEILERVETLIQAIKVAREEANSRLEVTAPSVGQKIFDYLQW